jgi:rhamnosyl/mannosyltransferase
MKVLHFYKTYYPDSYGGVQQVIYQLAEYSSQIGVTSEVLYLSPNGRRSDVPWDKHFINSSKLNFEIASTGFSWEVINRFKQLAEDVDLIHYHYPWPFMDLVHFLSGTKKPAVVSYHSDIVKQRFLLQLYKPLMHCFLNSTDAIVAASPAYIEHSQVLKKYKDKTHVIPYGLDEESYPLSSEAKLSEWRAKVPERFFLFVGALRYYKGLHYLLEAAHLNGLPVIIVGSGGIEKDLHEQAHHLNTDQVVFTGSLGDEDRAALLQLCTAFVFPSHLPSEAFGISLLEAAVFGKPLISCEIGTGTTFINIDGVTGLAVAPADPEALSAAMVQLWEHPELCTTFGRNARARYEKYFTAKNMAESYVRLYEQVLLERAKAG